MIIGDVFPKMYPEISGSMKTPGLQLCLILIGTVLILSAGCINQPQAGNQAPATAANAPVTEFPSAAQTMVVPSPVSPPSSVPSSSVPSTGGTSPAPAQVSATVPVDSLPTDITLPPTRFATDIRIDKDRAYSTITVTFVGGAGQVFVRDILVRVTRSDGLKEEAHIPFENQVPVGASVDLPGTKGSDRVEVYVTINGVIYKVRDENAVYEVY